jgi:single-strand DNA-binding protein
MPSLNLVQIIGNLGKEPEMRFAPSGKPTTSFPVAVNNKYQSNGETKEETEWFNVVTWGKTAELCNQYLHKGSMIYAEGRLKTRSWDGNDGQKHWRTELIANRVLFLDKLGKPTENQQPAEEGSGDIEPDNIPF